MSKQSKAKRNGGPASASARKKFPAGAVVLPALAAIVVLGLWLNRSQPAATPKDTRPADTNVPGASAATAAPKTEPGFQKLVGRWLRPDGGYVIEVKSVNDSGGLEAAYFNPRPIHVARAEASRDGGVMKLFIELRDVNYPGSTYTLAYSPESDQLRGIYFQAVEQQNFEVIFERMTQ